MEFTNKEKQILLWASFASLAAAGVGFVFRSMVPNLWVTQFNITNDDVGILFGAGLWPIAVMMILFSFVVDKIGYQKSMFFAFALQAISVFLTFTATNFTSMWFACVLAGAGHGVVEAVINPLCVSVFRTEKTKAMNILHAAWPAGNVVGGIVFLSMYQNTSQWAIAKTAWFFMLIPVLVYGWMFFKAKKFPVDERVEANIPMSEMFKEFGGLSAALAGTFIIYELLTQISIASSINWATSLGMGQYSQLILSIIVGLAIGTVFGFSVKALGKPMFFFLCLIMIPLATAEIATDGWIRNLMMPTMGVYSGWALVFSMFIMMILRFSSGIPLKIAKGPLGLLLISSVFSIIGLFWLSVASGVVVFLAFIFYAVGQTYYWPSILGFTSERFPKGGALTLNTVSAMGLLTVGIFGFPFLGAVQDHYNTQAFLKHQPALVETVKTEGRTIEGTDQTIYTQKSLFGVGYTAINNNAISTQAEFDVSKKEMLDADLKETGRRTLRVAAWLPITMAIGFILILMWFRANGGYKPIILADEKKD